MTRLSHAQWTCVHHLSLEVHLIQTEQDLIDLVLLRVPEVLGINHIVWHERSKPEGLSPDQARLSDTYRSAIHNSVSALNESTTTHHLDIADHAAVEFWHDDKTGVLICFNAPSGFDEETKLMIHLLHQHLSGALLRFKENQAKKKRNALNLPHLDQAALKHRERETLPHVLHGKSNSEIAIILGISPRTAEKHVASIIEKTGAENRKTLISEAKYLSA